MFGKLSLLYAATLVTYATAHIEMKSPAPFKSKYNSDTKAPDYSMTSPLSSSGSDYPAKGYATPEAIQSGTPQATLNAGSSVSVELAGSATHEGGSCQFGLSYDGGETILVVHSVIGGCPIPLKYDVPIPQDVPSAEKALFFWTWQNKVGNREEYQNAALVKVEGGSGSWTAPVMWRANTLPDGTCITKEGTSPVYPNPGPSVEYGGEYASQKPESPTILDPCSLGKQDEDATVSGPTTADNYKNSTVIHRSDNSTYLEAHSPTPTCDSEGSISCDAHSMNWYSCTQGEWRSRGPVPEEVTCYDGFLMSDSLAESIKAGNSTIDDIPAQNLNSGKNSTSTPDISSVQNSATPSNNTATAVPKAQNATTPSNSSATPATNQPTTTPLDTESVSSSPASVESDSTGNGAFVHENSVTQAAGSCQAGAEIKCSSGGKAWSLCDADGQSWVDMGAVPEGIDCVKKSQQQQLASRRSVFLPGRDITKPVGKTMDKLVTARSLRRRSSKYRR